jgi:citrate synthase
VVPAPRPLKRRRAVIPPQGDGPDYLSREETLRVLGVKAATLYTYVSRGLVKSVAIKGSKSRQFLRRDVENLLARSLAHSGVAARAEGTMRWGEPIFSTQITEITPDGPRYRGLSAIELSRAGTSFEALANFLWSGAMPDDDMRWSYRAVTVDPDKVVDSLGVPLPVNDVLKLFSLLVLASGLPDAGLTEFSDGRTALTAQQIIQVLAGSCGFLQTPHRFVPPREGESIAATVARALGAEGAEQTELLINAALVLCADLELAPGTFAARVAASAGSDLYACVAGGISAHAGELTGRGSDRAEDLLINSDRTTLKRRLEMLKVSGRKLFGFNHPYFPSGDPRAYMLIDLARRIKPLPHHAKEALWFLDEAREQCEAYPGMAVGLVILCLALGLPRRSAIAIWSVSRAAGQIAHALEQRVQGFVIRPRARYTSPV